MLATPLPLPLRDNKKLCWHCHRSSLGKGESPQLWLILPRIQLFPYSCNLSYQRNQWCLKVLHPSQSLDRVRSPGSSTTSLSGWTSTVVISVTVSLQMTQIYSSRPDILWVLIIFDFSVPYSQGIAKFFAFYFQHVSFSTSASENRPHCFQSELFVIFITGQTNLKPSLF